MNRTWVAVAVAVGGIVLAGCSDDGDDGGDLAAFCEANATIDGADPFAAASADEAEQVATEMRTALEAGLDSAPAAVEDDVVVLHRSFGGMLDELEAAGYEPGAVDPDELFAATAEAEPELESALENVGAFVEDEC